MNATQIISAKRDGQMLTRKQLDLMVSGFVSGSVPDYQMSALAMAIYFQGMSDDETSALTELMLHSGQVMTWPPALRPVVDKHSTGGIGDKTSIVLAPLLACCDLIVPMISGRGLGATGGTLDKLEAIRGFNCDLSIDQVQAIARQVGCVISGATAEIAPADNKLYALRDVTGTVPSIPLITASILSKKLAEGLDSLVLDVKWGTGSFMKSLQAARELAVSLVRVGSQLGVKTTALITDMNQPLGHMVGNLLEIEECLAVLKGNGPADVRSLVIELGAEVISTCRDVTMDEGRAQLTRALTSGAAMDRFEQMVAAQGGDLSRKQKSPASHELIAPKSGWIHSIRAENLGWAVIDLGGGRRAVGDAIDHRTGIESMVRIGTRIEVGQGLARVYCNRLSPETTQLIAAAYEIGDAPVEAPPLVVECVTPKSIEMQ